MKETIWFFILRKHSTERQYEEYEVIGEHFDLLAPGYVEHNSNIIQRIVKAIIERGPAHQNNAEKRLYGPESK